MLIAKKNKRYRCTSCSFWTDDPQGLQVKINKYFICPKCSNHLREVPKPGHDLNQTIDMNFIDREKFLYSKGE